MNKDLIRLPKEVIEECGFYRIFPDWEDTLAFEKVTEVEDNYKNKIAYRIYSLKNCNIVVDKGVMANYAPGAFQFIPEGGIIFHGILKNKSEFKKVLQQIGVL